MLFLALVCMVWVLTGCGGGGMGSGFGIGTGGVAQEKKNWFLFGAGH